MHKIKHVVFGVGCSERRIYEYPRNARIIEIAATQGKADGGNTMNSLLTVNKGVVAISEVIDAQDFWFQVHKPSAHLYATH